MNKLITLLTTLLLVSACSSDKKSQTQHKQQASDKQSLPTTDSQTSSSESINYTALDQNETGVDFVNKIEETVSRSQLTYDYFYNGGGVAIADFDNDGMSDLFFTGNDSPNKIYKNLGNMKFKDMTASALPKVNRWSQGVTTVDINDDGYMDIYICNSGPDDTGDKLENQLLINKGNFTFVDEAKSYGVNSNHQSVQADFIDFDKDGDLDLWVNNHGLIRKVDKLMKQHDYYNLNNGNMYNNLNRLTDSAVTKGKLQLYVNNDGKFTDMSVAKGINVFAFGLGISVADYNGDNYPDVFVSNDYFVPDFMFYNNRRGGFALDFTRMNHTSFYSMGSDANDYNNDGIMDLIAVDMTPKDHYRSKTLMESMDVDQFIGYTEICNFPRAYMFNTLQVGIGDGYFNEIANALDIGLTDWSWSPLFMDMDNDGFQDLVITNGYYRDTKNQDYRTKVNDLAKEHGDQYFGKMAFDLLKEQQSTPVQNVFYKNVAGQMEEQKSLMSEIGASFSNGAAYGDLDNDGDLDLVINNLLSEATILKNNTSGNYLTVKLKSKKAANLRHAQVTIYTKNGLQKRDFNGTRGYLSSMENRIHFGLGSIATIDSLKIQWPNQSVHTMTSIKANQELIIDYDASSKVLVSNELKRPLYKDASIILSHSKIYHTEDFHNDFNQEVLLPQKYSSLGPALATGDINKDGATDFYIGGSKGYPGRLTSMKGNVFEPISENVFKKDAKYEDIGSHFFDANSDGTLDLYVASGGNTDINDALLQDRLYINRNGQFSRDEAALPKINSSTMTISSFDFDKDNDLDLFVGGRNVPGAYPDKATSYVLINNKGKFKKAAMKDFYEALPNMVTDSEVVDLNNDGYQDLVVSGEWSYPKFFINEGGKKLVEKKYNTLTDLNGWWYSVTKGDFNKDGKPDFIFGNLGTNNKFHASQQKPLSVYYDDFDENGSQDIFLAKIYKDELVPVRGKECSSEQMPVLNDKFKTYDAFASAGLADILGADKIDKSGNLVVNYFKSVVLVSKGAGYEVIELPFEAQWAPVLDCIVEDYNQDGHQDVLIAGNMFNTEPETPSYDAGSGTILINDGSGNFSPLYDITKTGLNLKSNVKRIAKVNRPGASALLVANNNNKTQFYIRNTSSVLQ